MNNHKPAPQIIEEFREREGESFVYGFGKTQPRVPFLFETSNRSESSLFQISQEDDFLDLQFDNLYIEDSSSEIKYSKSLQYFFISAVEAHIKRVSVKKYCCTICGYKSTNQECINHIITHHSQYLRDFLEPHIPYINNDDKAFSGIFTKCQFESIITPPSKPYQINRGQGGNISAPIIIDHDYEECEGQNEKNCVDGIMLPKYIDPINKPEHYCVYYGDGLVAPLTKFAQEHRPVPMFPEEEDSNEDNEKLEQVLYDFDRKEMILKPINDFYMPASDQQHIQQLQQKIQQDVAMQEKQQTQTPQKKFQKIEAKKLKEIEEIEKIEKKPAKKEPEKPKYISYINTIPTNIIDDVLKSIASKYIGEYVESTTLVISKPQLKEAKKAHSKKMRDEKLARQKAEEKRKLEAIRERRSETINRISEQVAKPLLRAFARQEISAILEEEISIARKARESPKCKPGSGGLLAPVVVSGLTSPKHLSLSFLYDLFSNLKFVQEENKKPMIRFRVRYQRYEVLLFLKSEQEVIKALAMSPMQVEWATAVLEMDTDLPQDGLFNVYTGQKILEMGSAKNTQEIHEDGGLMSLKRMSSVCDLSPK